MAKRKLERCGLDQYSAVLSQVGIVTVKDILEESPLRLLQILDMSVHDLKVLLDQLSELVAPKSRTALEIHRERSLRCCYISSGLSTIDDKLRGGLPFGSITEVCGPPGIGKTQFCLNVCLRSLLRPLSFGRSHQDGSSSHGLESSSVVYIDTELKFDSNRILEIVSNLPVPLSSLEAEGLLERIHIYRPTTCKDLLDLIEVTIQSVIIENCVRLVVIDSIAALAKKENLNEADKEQYLVRLAGLLKEIGDESNCCILITNQISAVSVPARGIQDQSPAGTLDGLCDHVPLAAGDNTLMKASLGSIWHHCVSTRLMMYLDESGTTAVAAAVGSRAGQFTRQRVLSVMKSPVSEHCSVCYDISVVGVGEVGVFVAML